MTDSPSELRRAINIRPLLRLSWFEFCRLQLLEFGYPSFLPSSSKFDGLCFCGKSNMSYPHWPPSCCEEAVDQLECLLGKDHGHRGHLAHCWYSWLRRRSCLNVPLSVGNQVFCDYIATFVIDLCPKLSYLKVESDPRPSRYCGKNFCEDQCRPTLENGESFCLCVCRYHREECPIHRVS